MGCLYMNGMSSFTFLNALLLHKVQFVIKTFTLQKFHFTFANCFYFYKVSFTFSTFPTPPVCTTCRFGNYMNCTSKLFFSTIHLVSMSIGVGAISIFRY
jgi:hypothetical protein